MKIWMIGTAILIAAALAGPAWPDQPTVFELKYRGLSAPDDPLAYNSYWGFGGPGGATDPFVQAVKSQLSDCIVVYNRALPQGQRAVIELKDKKPVAFYFDTDGDGKLSANEKVPLAVPIGSSFPYAYSFTTPDFLIRTKGQREIPFRLRLVGNGNGSTPMWSPSCVLEGHGTLAGEPMRLVLYASGFDGSFTTFGSCSFALLPAGQELQGQAPRNTLSSLIWHKGTFYRVKLSGTHARDQTVRAILEKDTTPTGQVAVALEGKEPCKGHLTAALICSPTDTAVHLRVSDALSTLPVGQYQLDSGTLHYGVQSDGEWQVTFTGGPAFAVVAAQTSRLELGAPTLSVSAIKEQERGYSNAKELSTFARGTPILLTPQLKGPEGETYVRFSRTEGTLGAPVDLKSHLTIVGPDGRKIVSTNMEYG